MNLNVFFAALILVVIPFVDVTAQDSPCVDTNVIVRGFTRGCMKSLDRILKQYEAGGKDLKALRSQLDICDRNLPAFRERLDRKPSVVPEELNTFPELVRKIRFLKLDAPLLIVKRHAYISPHIYDDFMTWHPGGGIYVIENPRDSTDSQHVKAVVDPNTKATLGEGVYRDTDLSFDGKRMLFAFKGSEHGDTCIYEINIDGSGLRQVLKPAEGGICREKPEGLLGAGVHDYSPCYLPDGRIVFLSTRQAGLVMCFNNHIATLHVMNADGSRMRSVSVNNQSEFDPTVLPDGKVMFGRWEYIDKTALYVQSLWVMNPDGTYESALFKNNMAKPTAVLDARPVPDSSLIVASLTPHNGQSVGAIAMLDPKGGKNNLGALVNFTPEYPTEMDQGLSHGPCDPYPLDEDTVLISNNAPDRGRHSVIELIDRYGFRFVIRREDNIGCFSPVLVKKQITPPVLPSMIKSDQPARFFVSDIYQGLDGVKRGDVKQLRVIETTCRISGVPPGGRWWNQAFLVSWQGSYDVKNFIGTVPVADDGSAYFEAPTGKALYFQALDKDGRLIQSMRTFVQAAPGITRSCQGCHIKDDNYAPVTVQKKTIMAERNPSTITKESWGNGLLDYPTMIQPVLDRNCLKCHGGSEGIAGGIDLSGGWTWAFNISYETFIKNNLVGFINCHNLQEVTTQILPPRTHGSGAAPLAELIVSGHKGRLAGMSQKEKDLLLAWMDGNCCYYGSWDYTRTAVCGVAGSVHGQLAGQMEKAGCVKCHAKSPGNDWVNLKDPELSRILRAPMAKSSGGTSMCFSRSAANPRYPLVTQNHQPPSTFSKFNYKVPDSSETPVATFSGTNDVSYLAMLDIIRKGREETLKNPRVDMPGAEKKQGKFRELPALTPP